MRVILFHLQRSRRIDLVLRLCVDWVSLDGSDKYDHSNFSKHRLATLFLLATLGTKASLSEGEEGCSGGPQFKDVTDEGTGWT